MLTDLRIVENAYGGPIPFSSLKGLYDRFKISNYHILLGDGQEGCGIEPGIGTFYRNFSARSLNIGGGSDECHWRWLPASMVPGARFSEVAYLGESYMGLDLFGKITIRLPPGAYSLRWVLKFETDLGRYYGRCGNAYPWFFPIVFLFTDGRAIQSSDFNVRQELGKNRIGNEYNNRLQWKEDGWMEYMAGVFTVEEQIGTSCETHLKFEMKEKYVQRKSSLFVDGVVIRQQHNVEDLSLSEDSEPEVTQFLVEYFRRRTI
ncbi:hypothetical protein R1flu_003370 [Riccia fluitans]|uniref:Uncharacterized protein n=1 Tax=Riccia fluitans TaxID=41844 RepID=A0ABD1Y9E2_9MARC